MPGARDVVDDDGVEALALELVARVRDARRSPCSAAKPTSSWPGAALGGERGEHVLGALELERAASSARVGLLDLVGARVGRAVVGDGGGHQQHVGGREALAAGGGELGGGADVDVLDAGRARQRRRWPRRPSPWRRAARPPRRAPSPSSRSERLPTKRTASIGSRVPPAVTRTCSAVELAAGAAEARLDGGQQLGRLGQAADAPLARRAERAGAGLEHLDPARAQRLEVRARRRVLVHRIVHGRSDDQRLAGTRARRRSAGCRRARRRAWRSCWRRPARSGTASARSTSARCDSGACSGAGSPGKAPRSGSGSHSVISTGAPVMPANEAVPTKRVDASVWITRTAWPALWPGASAPAPCRRRSRR